MFKRLSSKKSLGPVEDKSSYEAPRPVSQGELKQRTSTSSSISRYSYLSSDSSLSRRSSVSTLTSISSGPIDFDKVPQLISIKTQWEAQQQLPRRSSTLARSRPLIVFPAHIFKTLPREIYDCILDHLKLLHFEDNESCPQCYLRDLCNISLTSRAWDQAATLQLYRQIHLLTSEPRSKVPLPKIAGTTRLKLLRRTLRERPALSKLVTEIHMPDFQTLYHNASIDRKEIADLVASLVMACPNLERLIGFNISYTHTFDRFSHALSTRRKLKERIWLLDENVEDEENEDDDLSENRYYDPSTCATENFLELNSKHAGLQSLVLHQQSPTTFTPLTFRAIIGTLRQFPVLQNLVLSNLPAGCFTNLALNSLPIGLRSLRLERLKGVSDKGLQKFAGSARVQELRSLVLVDMDVQRVATLAEFLNPKLQKLKRFTLVQDKMPGLQSIDQNQEPLFHSPTLQHLHWEIRNPSIPITTTTPLQTRISALRTEIYSQISGSDKDTKSRRTASLSTLSTSTTTPTNLLSTAIQSNQFPSLTTLRAPHDPDGILQSICKPLATALLPSDHDLLDQNQHSHLLQQDSIEDGDAAPPPYAPPPYTLTSLPPIRPYLPTIHEHPVLPLPALLRSRMAAESRIRAARLVPSMVIRVTDEEGRVVVEEMMGGFLGWLDSGVEYMVSSDRSRVDAQFMDGSMEDGYEEKKDEMGSSWILGVEDLVGVGDKGRGGCGHKCGKGVGVGVEGLF